MNIRGLYFFGLIAVSLLLGAGYYLEVTTGLTPCPLCLFQRGLFLLLGVFFLLGLFLSSKRVGRAFSNFFLMLTAIGGIVFSGRQVFLQHAASSAAHECGVSLQYMLHVLPLREVIQNVFAGGVTCAERGWIFLSLDMAEWALLSFIGFLLLGGYLFLRDL